MNKRKGMNGLLLTSVSAIGIGFASAALAAGSGSVYLTQTGTSQTATIDQSGGTSDRVGSSGTPFLQQNGAGTGSNVLVINQNAGTTSELANIGSLVHTGSGNVATGYQSGTANNAEIDQEGNNSSVSLKQSGANNGAPVSASWFNDPAEGNLILQDKTTNGSAIDVTQTSDINAAKGGVINIGQGGTGNQITATQTAHNDLWIRQGATAPDLWGWTNGDPFDPVNTPYSLSALTNSSITVHQSIGGVNPGGVNYAALGQGHGNGDAITVTQNGASNSVDVNQIGSGNIFLSTQTATNGNTDWNFVGGEAGWPGSNPNPLVSSNGDYQPITQIGTGNQYYSNQSGTNLWAFGSQVGNYNFLNSVQSGDQNTLYSAQLGNSNSIYAVQAGSLNVATVSQTHSGSTASFTQSGTSNTATITQ
jgi:hypothetical protein